MGTFANNLLVYGSSLDAVKRHYRQAGCPAYVAALGDDTVLVAEGTSEDHESEYESLSKSLSCAVFACGVIDSDVLIVDLLKNGEHVDFYVSNEEMLEAMSVGADSPRSMPMSVEERARVWCECLGKPDCQGGLAEVLAAPTNEEYVFVEEYQAALWRAIGLSTAGIGVDFRFLELGEVPSALEGVIERIAQVG